MADEIRKIANLRTEASAPDLPGRVQNEEFVFDEMIGAELVQEVCRHKDIRSVEKLFSLADPIMISGAGDSQKALLTAMAAKGDSPSIIIVPSQKDVFRWEMDLRFFAPDLHLYYFPLVEETGFNVTFSGTERLRDRMKGLAGLLDGYRAAVIATVVEAAQKIISPSGILENLMTIHMGEVIEREILVGKLIKLGYERVDQVERCGHFSVRGDIVDIFAINESHPFRVEFFDDEVDGIRVFNEDTQRSIDIRDDISILPAVIRGERSSSILSYLNSGRIFYDEPQRCEEELKKYFHEEAENKEKAFDWAGLVKTGRSGRKYRNREILFSFLKRDADLFKVKETATWKGRTMVNYQRQISLFFNDLTRLLKEGWSAVILTPRRSERKELEQYLSDYHVPVSQKVQKGKVTLYNGVFSGGFELPDAKMAFITAGDIFGKQKARRYKAGGKGKQIRYFSDLEPGDYVVQRVHGIGKYIGVKTIELEGVHRDYITISMPGRTNFTSPWSRLPVLKNISVLKGRPLLFTVWAVSNGIKYGEKPKSRLRNWQKNCWPFTQTVKSRREFLSFPIRRSSVSLRIRFPSWRRMTSWRPYRR